METASFHRLIMEKVEIGYFYCLIGDNTEMLLNSCPHFIRLLSELLNLIGCLGNINSKFSKTYMFMALANSLVVLLYCCATADILTKLLQQFFFVFHGCGYTLAIVR